MKILYALLFSLMLGANANAAGCIIQGVWNTATPNGNTGCTLDNAVIGGTTPAAGAFTTLSATGLTNKAIVGTNSSGQIIDAGILGVSSGGTGANTSSGMSTATSDNSVPLQAAVNAYVATMTANSSTEGFAPFLIPAGTYNFANTVTTRPWIKFNAIGCAQFNFASLASSGTAFRSHNQDAPSGNGSGGDSNIANQGSWLNGEQGCLYIKGPGTGSNVTTLSGAITNSATSITVASAASLTTGNQVIVDSEVWNITGISSNTLTVTRAVNGSIAQPHSSGAQVFKVYTNIALDMGDVQGTASNSGATDYRDVSVSKLGISDFGTGFYWRLTNNYFNRFDQGGNVFRANYGMATENFSGVNSGELDSVKNYIFSGGINGNLWQGSGTDYEVENTSIDYMLGSCAFFTGNANYMTVQYINTHFEHCEGGAIKSNIASLNSLVWYVRNGVYNAASALTHGSSPRQALFSGPGILDLDGYIISYAYPWHDATVGLFMVDSSTTIANLKNIRFAAFDYSQLPSLAGVLNEDPFFIQGTVGNDLYANPVPTWNFVTGNNMSAVVDNTNVLTAYNASAKSIKFTATGTGNYYIIGTNPVKVFPGQKLLADTCFYGGTSTGTGNVQLQFIFSSSSGNLPLTNDGTAFGDSMSAIYGDATDPAYTGGRSWQAKMNTLRGATVPAGYDQAQLQITIAALNSGDTVWLTCAPFNSLN